MNCINLCVKGRQVQLIVHDDGHEGASYDVVALIGRMKSIRFARFERLEDALSYSEKYGMYYDNVKFLVSRSFF